MALPSSVSASPLPVKVRVVAVMVPSTLTKPPWFPSSPTRSRKALTALAVITEPPSWNRSSPARIVRMSVMVNPASKRTDSPVRRVTFGTPAGDMRALMRIDPALSPPIVSVPEVKMRSSSASDSSRAAATSVALPRMMARPSVNGRRMMSPAALMPDVAAIVMRSELTTTPPPDEIAIAVGASRKTRPLGPVVRMTVPVPNVERPASPPVSSRTLMFRPTLTTRFPPVVPD
ncbi:MAG: hypothetical protein FP819_25525 [Rhizobiaceae bacterium]|nr:hypothetical protein [Rhizobiaceae bacterium]